MQVKHCTCLTVGYFFSLTNDNYKEICLHKIQAGRGMHRDTHMRE